MKSISDAISDVISQLSEDLPTKCESIIIYKSVKPEKIMRLSLSGRCINSLGDFSSTDISHITELDLSSNFIHSWEDISHILAHLRKLKFLDLSFNPLHSAEDKHFLPQIPQHPNLTELVLNGTKIAPITVKQVLRIFPNLAKLWLCLNEYAHLKVDDASDTLCPSLRELHLGVNKIRHSEDIQLFCSLLPGLEYLSLRENPLTELTGLNKDSDLRGINLCHTLIEEWGDLTYLNNFTKFSGLHLLSVPLLKKVPEESRRDFCISYLPGLKVLNKTPVTEKEREKAERSFIRCFMNTSQKPERFFALKKIHGELSPLVELDLSPPKMISVKLECDGFPSRTLSVELVKSVTYLRGLVYRELFENDRKIKFKMFYVSAGIPEEMKYPQKLLYTFRIRDGDLILVVVL